MAKQPKGGGISWTNETWNPIRGCSVVSAGCKNCYAMQVAARFSGTDSAGKPLAYHGLAYRNSSGAHWTGKVRMIEEHLEDPLRWQRPRMIFVNSMSDLFHEGLSDFDIDRVFAVMAGARRHTFQVLTKRPERMRRYLSDPGLRFRLEALPPLETKGIEIGEDEWPLPNIWIGTSVEDQKTAHQRIPELIGTPAAVRWLSAEPLIGPLDLPEFFFRSIHWIVVGGESGDDPRPMPAEWVRDLRDQCAADGVAFFFKQGSAADWPDFKNYDSFPEEFKIREFPRS
jgi:protein gp37